MRKTGFRIVILGLWVVGPLWLGLGIFLRDYLPELGDFYRMSFQALKAGHKV